MGKGYNDAGARVKLLEGKDDASKQLSEDSSDYDKLSKSQDEIQLAYNELKAYFKKDPKLKALFLKIKDQESDVGPQFRKSLEEALADEDYSSTAKRNAYGLEQSQSKQIKSMEDLLKAKKLLEEHDEEGE